MTDTILNVATFQGDGIGPDVINSAIQIIKKASIKVDNLNINGITSKLELAIIKKLEWM